MRVRKALHFLKRPAVAGGIVILVLLFVFSLILYERALIYKAPITRELTNVADDAKERLETNLTETRVALATLSYSIGKHGSASDFDEVAKNILETSPSVDELALVEGEVITHVYPQKGNEKAIGHNVFKDSNQNRQVFKTLERKKLTFAGPCKLAQGGTGIIARQPIYIGGKYFGFATAVLNPERTFQKIIIKGEYVFQVSKIDSATGVEEFLLPSPETINLSSAVSVTLAQGGWKIYVNHAKPQSFSTINFFLLALFGITLSFFSGFFIWQIMSQPERLKTLVEQRTQLLERSTERYRSLYDRASDAIAIMDYQYNLLDVNKSMCSLLGYNKEKLLQMNMKEIINGGQQKELTLLGDILKEGGNSIMETQLRRKEGGIVEIEINLQGLGDGRIMGIGRNVAELRKVQRQVAFNEKLLANSFDYSSLGMALVTLEGRFIKVNKALCKMLGFTESELLSLSFQQITHPADLDENVDYIIRAKLKEAVDYRTEKRYFHKNGSVIWVNMNTSVVKDEAGQPVHFITQIEDITEKKKMTGLLKEKEYQLRIFIEHSPAALAMFDQKMNYIMISNKYRTDYNLGPIEIIGKSHYDIFPTIPDRWKKIHQKCLAGAVEKCEEDSFLREDGSIEWLKWEIHPWRKDSGEIGGVILFSERITELKESQLKFQNLVEKSLVGVYIIQSDRLPYVNPRFAEIFGYSAAELMNMDSILSVFHKDDIETVRQHIRERMEGTKTSVHYEARGVKKNGDVIWLDIYGTSTLYDGAKAIIGSLLDITENKKSQAVILHEKNLSDTIINGLPGLFYIFHPDGRMIRWNKHLETITGYNSQEIGQMKTGDFVYPEQLDSIAHFRKNIFNTGKASAEVKILTKQKQILIYYITIMPIVYNGENCVLGLGIDFTEKNAAEIALVKKNWEINEKIKELDCLFKLSELVNKEVPVEQILARAVQLIPPAYHYPEKTCASISYGEKVFTTSNFIKSRWRQEALIGIGSHPIGKIMVCCNDEKTLIDEEHFLDEERYLINSVADILGNAIERKLASEEIIKLNRLYQFTSAINEMILRTEETETIFSDACQIAIEYGKFRMVWIGLHDRKSHSVVPFAWAGHTEGYLDKLKISTDPNNHGKGPTGSAIRNHTYYYCNDIENDPVMTPWKTEALKRGYHSSISLPIIISSEVVAVFNLYMDKALFFNEQEIKLLKDVTDNIAYAIEKIELKELQRRSDEKLKESEEKFRKLVEETLAGVFIVQDGVFKYVNPQFEAITGYTKEEMVDVMPFYALIYKDDVETMKIKYATRLNGRNSDNHYFVRGVKKDGSVRYIEVIVSGINYQSKSAVIGTAIDITEQVEEENRISKAVTDAQENERQQISMELHDNVKQIMAASLLNMEYIGMNIDNKESTLRIIGNVKNYIRDAIEELRKISHQLAPAVDAHIPLEEKVKALISAMNVSKNVKVSYRFEYTGKPVDKDVQLALYRILQEQFSNIIKYAKATSVRINLVKEDENIVMSIRDNGIGFDTTIRKNGIGLENIKRRIQILKGRVDIISKPGKGCILRVQIPVG